jgi:DNA-binding transcriptional ArsR family regulator
MFTIEMNTPTSPAFSPAQQKLADVAKALAHPARIAILQLLVQRRTCYCGDIVEELPLAQATVSQHLRVLKAAGLIQGKIDPRSSCYCIDPQGWAQASALLGGWLAEVQPPTGDFCCD